MEILLNNGVCTYVSGSRGIQQGEGMEREGGAVDVIGDSVRGVLQVCRERARCSSRHRCRLVRMVVPTVYTHVCRGDEQYGALVWLSEVDQRTGRGERGLGSLWLYSGFHL